MPTVVRPFHRTGGLGLSVIFFSTLVAVGWIGATVLQHSAQEDFARVAAFGGAVGPLTVVWLLTTLALFPTLLVTGLLTASWLTVAHGNAERLEPRHLRRNVAWAWFGWIFPLFLLGRPREMVEDVLWVTDRSAARLGTRARAWWTCWIGLLLLTFGSSLYLRLVDDPGRMPLVLDAATAVLTVLALGFWIGVVRRVDAAAGILSRHGYVPREGVVDPYDRFAPAPLIPDTFATAPAPPGALPPQTGSRAW